MCYFLAGRQIHSTHFIREEIFKSGENNSFFALLLVLFPYCSTVKP